MYTKTIRSSDFYYDELFVSIFMPCPFWEADQALMIPKWSQLKPTKNTKMKHKNRSQSYMLKALHSLFGFALSKKNTVCFSTTQLSRFTFIVLGQWIWFTHCLFVFFFFFYVTQWKWHGRAQRKWNCKRDHWHLLVACMSLHWCASRLIWLFGCVLWVLSHLHISFKNSNVLHCLFK